jgi:hypothetical protein
MPVFVNYIKLSHFLQERCHEKFFFRCVTMSRIENIRLGLFSLMCFDIWYFDCEIVIETMPHIKLFCKYVIIMTSKKVANHNSR